MGKRKTFGEYSVKNMEKRKKTLKKDKCKGRSIGVALIYSGRGKFMPLPLKSKILEPPGF